MSTTELAAQGDNLSNYQSLERFQQILNQQPSPQAIERTPDGRAVTVTIAHVESTLDEIYLGAWGSENEQIMRVENELIMSITLWVIHPITGLRITRTGCAAVQITADAAPDNIKGNPQARNAWAINPANKKPNACYLSSGKLKALALKNAAQTLGNIFGRSLNRKNDDTPESIYTDMVAHEEALQNALEDVNSAADLDHLKAIWEHHKAMQNDVNFKAAVNSKKSMLAYAG